MSIETSAVSIGMKNPDFFGTSRTKKESFLSVDSA